MQLASFLYSGISDIKNIDLKNLFVSYFRQIFKFENQSILFESELKLNFGRKIKRCWCFSCHLEGVFCCSLFKSGDKRDVSCYRGISILSAIPKLFEKMVCDRITPVVRHVISERNMVL
jgi:hypothetical protein